MGIDWSIIQHVVTGLNCMSAAFAQRIAVRSTYKSEAVGLVCKFNVIHCHGHRLRQIELFLRIFLYLHSDSMPTEQTTLRYHNLS